MAKKKLYLKPVSCIKPLTVELAKKLLATQDHDTKGLRQRRIKPHKIAEYMNLLKTKTWAFTGESIVIDWFGILRDGGNRCTSVVKTGITMPEQNFVYGINPKNFTIIDSGNSRSLADVFYICKEKYSFQLRSSVNILHLYHNKRTSFRGTLTTFNHDIGLKMLYANYDIVECVSYCHSAMHKYPILDSCIGGALYFLCSKIDPEKALDFFQRLYYGVNLPLKHPIRSLRDTLLRGKGPDHTIDRDTKIAMIISIWNMLIINPKAQTKSFLEWRTTKNPKTPMPRFVDSQGKEIQIKIVVPL